MGIQDMNTDMLVERAEQGDSAAVQELFSRYRAQLRRMISVHMDRRMAVRVDPSDVVQDTLVQASNKLSDYLQQRPLPFYPWLRRLASERLIQLYRHHIRSQKRSILREQTRQISLPDESVVELANQLIASDTSPSSRFARGQRLDQVKSALERLATTDREVLVLRHLEQLTVPQTAEVLGVSQSVVKTRHFRAIQRLHRLLEESSGKLEP